MSSRSLLLAWARDPDVPDHTTKCRGARQVGGTRSSLHSCLRSLNCSQPRNLSVSSLPQRPDVAYNVLVWPQRGGMRRKRVRTLPTECSGGYVCRWLSASRDRHSDRWTIACNGVSSDPPMGTTTHLAPLRAKRPRSGVSDRASKHVKATRPCARPLRCANTHIPAYP